MKVGLEAVKCGLKDVSNAGHKASNIVLDGVSNGPKALKLGPGAVDIQPKAALHKECMRCLGQRP